MPTCRGIRLDGAPCTQRAKRGGDFCWQHQPGSSPNCVVCRHPRRVEIEAMLGAGARFSEVATPFRLSTGLVRYHRRSHMSPAGAEGAGGQRPSRSASDGEAP